MSYSLKALAALCAGLVAVQAHAAVDPAVRCESGQLKASASYAACLLKADAVALLKNLPADYSKCTEKIVDKFSTQELKATCPSEGEVNDVMDVLDSCHADVTFILSGETTTTTTTTTTLGPTGECGDGFIDAGEDCDIGNLGGGTCAGEGFFNGTLTCGPGCAYNTTQCNPTRFEDAGATILDHQTNLEWEKKDGADGVANAANPHDVDNLYTWAASGNVQSGTVFTSFLMALNGTTDGSPPGATTGCYDGRCDWRIPNIVELKSIAVLSPGCGAAPCIQDPLFAPVRNDFYWSVTTRASVPTGAYVVTFNTGAAASDLKTASHYVRAVRSIE